VPGSKYFCIGYVYMYAESIYSKFEPNLVCSELWVIQLSSSEPLLRLSPARHTAALSAQLAAFGAIFHHTLAKCVYTMQVSVWGPKKSVWGLEKKCVGGVKNVWGP